MASAQDPSPHEQKKPNQSNNYLKYSGWAFQMLGAIGILGWLGYLLDQYLRLSFPAFMLVFGVLGFFGVLYQWYRSIKKM